MPRPVCVNCACEMTITRSGTVQFDAIATHGVYQQWQADFAQCPICRVEIAFRYGGLPSWEHHNQSPRGDPIVVVPERRLDPSFRQVPK